ncbi:hypothetical protein FRB90_007066, partial [Tulasnella sp. 427]
LAASGSLRTGASPDPVFAHIKGDTASRTVEDDLRWILRPNPTPLLHITVRLTSTSPSGPPSLMAS